MIQSKNTVLNFNTSEYTSSDVLLIDKWPLFFQGRVAFNSEGDRIAWTQIEQMWGK